VDVVDVVHRSEAEPTPPGVDWGSLIWPGGRPTGDTQVLADREAAAAAIAARAATHPGDGQRGRADHVWRDRPLVSRVAAPAAPEPADPAPVATATLTEEAPRTAPELEPWNPEATYDSLVRLLDELKALHPDEVAVLPRRPSRLAVRRPGRVLAAVAAAAVLAAGVGTLVVTHHSGGPPAATVAAPRMSTVLVTIDTGDTLAGANLLASDGAKAQEILLPSRLLVDLPGQGSTQLSAAPRSGPDAAAMAVENALHVRVGGTWTLDPTSLGALVTAEGGVDVTLTSDVLPGDGSAALSIGVGTSHLSGAQAEQLAVAIGAQEPEASRLARQQILLEAILAKLPTSPGQIVPLLAPTQVSGGLTPGSLAALLANVRKAVAAGQAASTVVPNTEIDSGSGTPSYGLDESGTATMVSTRLAGATLPVPAGGRARILVQNGVGTPGLGEAARAVLVAKGYSFRSGGNAFAFSTGPSVVLVPDSTPQSRAVGSAVAQLLGLPASAVELDSNPTTIADVKVILGADFTPRVAATP
jgi:hypothetical protein